MVDRERLARLLDRALADVTRLSRFRDTRAEPVDDVWLAAVKYTLVTAIEGCGRIAHHLAASEGWPVAESNADAIRELGSHDVVDPVTAEPVARSVGLRNLLVHQYADVDDGRVVATLDRIGDLERFLREVAVWLARQPG